MNKKISLLILIISLIYSSTSFSETQEYQGVKLRVLNKDTTEKSFYTLPLSQTLEINNTVIIVHRCVLKIDKGKQEEVALISHEFKNFSRETNKFFGWIFKSSHYINSPHNPTLDIRLHSCLEKDPIFLKKSSF